MNRLARETSPYLLQHAENPVDWYRWGPEALERARAEDRPILLSVGYAACHWCHVMERESFENDATAALMNEHFVCVKVDREERPDVDAVYMDAVVALTGGGGWPMTVFLTPGEEPFFGGTYYPPEPRHGLPSFRQVLIAVAEAWRDRRDEIERTGGELAAHLRAGVELQASREPLTATLLADARRGLRSAFDPREGGFGRAPKFPPGPVLEFLLRSGEEEMTRTTLDAMARGGMYDLVGGGFHRYSVDERWLVPHFEKMLYDNALLAAVYVHAWRRFGDERYRHVAEQTIDYVLRELALDGGGFASAQDADTDGVEGLTFTWAPGEGAPEELLEPFEHGRFVLRGDLDEATRGRLFALREQRPKPARDDKAVASWNGLMLAALAAGARAFDRADWLAAGERLGAFLLDSLSTGEGRLHRTWRDGAAKGTGYLSDYADVAYGLLELHVATGDVRWLRESHRLATAAARLFAAPGGGFVQVPADGEQLVAPKIELDDHPTPSGNAMLAYVLLRLARIWGDDELERQAVGVLRLVQDAVTRVPSALGWALVAIDQYLAPHREIAVAGRPGDAVARAAVEHAAATDVIAFGPADDVPLLAGRLLVDGRPAVYLCERFACGLPVTDPAELA
ncbi:MAG TPA: thioredoxin domain-containing protein [Gaiellaceae bacterium]